MRIDLPNACSITPIKVTPKNWEQAGASIKKPWLIHYTFYDTSQPKGFRVQVRGMNDQDKLKDRQKSTRDIITAQLKNLMEGYNPFSNSFNAPTDFEVNPYTPFIEALNIAIGKIRVSPKHLINMKSHLRHVERSAIELNIHRMPLKDVTRKYFNRIFDACYKNNEKFTGSSQNRYKKTLHRIYKELFKMEAVEFNPLALIERVRAVKKTRVMPTEEQRKKINKYLKENEYEFWRAVQMFYHSGAREAEFMRLQVKDVNLKAQEVTYTIEKGIDVREGVIRPIKNSVLRLWKEIMKGAKPDDYLFSVGLKPGPAKIREDQFHRRWKVHVIDKLGINVALYTLKHHNTTAVMDELDKFYNPAKDVAKMNAHNEAMVIEIYDTKNKGRKIDKIKGVKNVF